MSTAILMRKPRPRVKASLLLAVLVLVLVLAASFASGCMSSQAAIYERDGLAIAIPGEYADRLLIDPVEHDDERTLISVYQKAAYEKYPGMGLLFHIVRYTEAEYEQALNAVDTGLSFFARDDACYYGFTFPTDVQSPEDYEEYQALFSSVGDFVRNDFVQRNRLTAYDDDEFFSRTYTYDSEHVFITYYPYYSVNGSKDVVWILCLSQPARQGEGGIWCVERWRDEIGNVYVYFPDADGVPSREYYAALQTEADAARQDPQFDAGHSLLDPEHVASEFVKGVFGHTPVAGSFERTDSFGTPQELFARSSRNIHDYMPKLIAEGKDGVSPYDLLPCLEHFTKDTWEELRRAYGLEWWESFWDALFDAALSDMAADPYDQIMRNYYLGKLFLASDGAYAERTAQLVLLQWNHHNRLYSAALDKFTPSEADSLRGYLSGLVSYSEDAFKVDFFPQDGRISLNAYPDGFPFGTNLTASGSETFHAEGLGQVTIIDSDGFQLKYLDEEEGIYYVYCIRTTMEGASAKGVAAGDPEERLWDRWSREELRKLSRISHEDEGWFGGDYDCGYVYVPEGGTKSIIYLIKDGKVAGIGLADGLFGSMY
ncbi:MAG: hypothetical protein GX784_02380 [Firmicutes bacterium]|nr:hypothetical protein [Candidatus Fermentithermobacillaceae bacterium]